MSSATTATTTEPADYMRTATPLGTLARADDRELSRALRLAVPYLGTSSDSTDNDRARDIVIAVAAVLQLRARP